MYQLGSQVSGLRLKIQNVFDAPQLSYELPRKLSDMPLLEVHDWTEQLGAFFKAVSMEKHMMFLILVLIIAVAAFNLVSTLVMVVNEKASDIAILRTLGATPRMVMMIFIIQGAIVGIMGAIIGVAAGLLLASHVTQIVDGLQHFLGVQFISSSVYVVDYLPSRIEGGDVGVVAAVAIFLSLIATLYPAWRAARLQPVEALRYE